MNIAIIGPSGAGKGTHAAALSTRFRLRHVATGDLLRDNLHNRTALGILARKYMDQGELVPDEIVDAMIEEWCDRLPPEKGALFDGFPRTVSQAHFIDDLLERSHRPIDAVVYLKVPDDEIVQRLSGRLICRSCQTPYHQQFKAPEVYGVCDECGGELYHRPDDSTEIVRSRLRVFHRAIGGVLEHYAAAGKLVICSGEDASTDVQARLVRALEGIRNRSYGFATIAEAAALMPSTPGVVPAHLARTTVDLVLLGAPGCGKGTQADRLCDALGVPHIATGDLFRENLKFETPLGKVAKTYMERGELVPDDVTDAMVDERLGRPDAGVGFVLDGFPRTLHQAQALNEILQRHHRRLAGVIYYHVADDAILDRLLGRLTCQKCQTPYHIKFHPPQASGICDKCGGTLIQRLDDNPTTIGNRLATFHRQTEPLLAFYKKAALLHEVPAEGKPAEITAQSLLAIHEFAPAVAIHAPAGV
jgi:adenylate kinase